MLNETPKFEKQYTIRFSEHELNLVMGSLIDTAELLIEQGATRDAVEVQRMAEVFKQAKNIHRVTE